MHLFCIIDLLVHDYTAYANLCQRGMVSANVSKSDMVVEYSFCVLVFSFQVLVFSSKFHCVFYVGCQVGAFCVCKHSKVHPVSAHCKCCRSCDQCCCSCVFRWCSFKYRSGCSSPLYQSFFFPFEVICSISHCYSMHDCEDSIDMQQRTIAEC